MAQKRYYWLKLKEDFFEDKQIKFLKSLPDGDRIVIAYLKMQLKSLKTEGFIKYDSILPSNIDELAMILDEDKSIISLMINALCQVKAVEILDDGSFYMIAMQELIGNESDSAERVRKYRENKKMLQCNTDVTKCNIEKEIDKDIELDIDKEKSKKKFIKPTIEEIEQYCLERNNGIDANAFYDFYESKNWFIGKTKMKDWKACVRTWERRENPKPQKKSFLDIMREEYDR